MIKIMARCNANRLPLVELLSDDGDDIAPNRLLQLQLPDRVTRWVCSNREEAYSRIGHSVRADTLLQMRWQVPRRKTVSQHRQGVDALRDFQSTVVLARPAYPSEASS